ncbi:MAG: S26 family signal peptidase [Treponema sp.]|jgi:signal peptidase I|nr:S26 family signal peptidase [Treponema sp.]
MKAEGKTFLAVLGAFAAALLIKGFLVDFMIVEGRSMLPALSPGAVVLLDRRAYGIRLPGADSYLVRWAGPAVGDVVVFISPGGQQAVKRCTALTREGKVYVLGDNGDESYDSRSYGPVSAESILGKALGVK